MQVCIGEGDNLITVQVLEIRGDVVRLGLTAPSDVPIFRQEVYQRIQAGENQRRKA